MKRTGEEKLRKNPANISQDQLRLFCFIDKTNYMNCGFIETVLLNITMKFGKIHRDIVFLGRIINYPDHELVRTVTVVHVNSCYYSS